MVRNFTQKSSIIKLDHVSKTRGTKSVFSDVSFTVESGQCVGLIGPNGSGKSTLLRGILGFEKFDNGIVYFEDEELTQNTDLALWREQIGFVAQGLHLWPYRTVRDNVAEGPRFGLKLPRQEAYRQADHWMTVVGVIGHANKYPGELSGGEAQRVAIARALAMKPKVLLLDEPTSGLDPITSGEISECLQGLRREGISMLVVSHQIDFIRHVADKALFLFEGKIHESGYAEEMLTAPKTKELTEFIARVRKGW